MQSSMDSEIIRCMAASVMALHRCSQVLLLLVFCRVPSRLLPPCPTSGLYRRWQISSCHGTALVSSSPFSTLKLLFVTGSQSFNRVGVADVYKREGQKFSKQWYISFRSACMPEMSRGLRGFFFGGSCLLVLWVWIYVVCCFGVFLSMGSWVFRNEMCSGDCRNKLHRKFCVCTEDPQAEQQMFP